MSKKNNCNRIVRMSCYMLILSITFAGQAIACYCNTSGQMEGGGTCSADYTCSLLENGQFKINGLLIIPPVDCGQNGCSGEINGNQCYCNVKNQ